MRLTLFAATAAIAATLWLPGEAAQPTPRDDDAGAAVTTTASTNAGTADEPITFDAYRDWRLNFIERRRSELAVQLSAADLPASRQARLGQIKAYYDWFAGLAEADRDSRFRQRFDRIDTNHDGKIDAAERAAWHDKQRAFYRRDRLAATHPAAEDAKP